MSYEDVVKVAAAKIDPARLPRIAAAMGINPGEPFTVTEFLKPGLEEMCSLLPPALATRIFKRFGPRAIEAAVQLYGAERIVCGTDGTEFGCEWTRKAIVEAEIGEEAVSAGRAAGLVHQPCERRGQVHRSATGSM